MHNLIFKAGILLTLTSSPIVINSPEYNNVNFKEFKNETLDTVDTSMDVEKTDYSKIIQTQNDIKNIEYYSNVFELDSKVIINKLQELTNNFEYEWTNDYKELNIYNQDLNYIDEKELITLLLIRDISNNPENYGLDSENIKGEPYEQTENHEDINLKYSKLFGIDPKIPLSITYAECSWELNSNMYINDHNPAGAVGYSYDNIEVGIIKHIMNLVDNYDYCDLESSDFFYQAQKKYCPDNDGSWISHNLEYYNNLSDNYYYYNLERNEKVLTK